MNCKHCGEKLAAFSHYCENCGEKGPSPKEWWGHLGKSVGAFLKKRLWLTITTAAVLVAIIGLSIWWSIANHFDVTDYIVTEISGFNEDGSIRVSIDYNALCERVIGPKPDTNTAKGYEKYAEYLKQREMLLSTLSVSADRTSGLKNGDFYIVTVTVLDEKPFKEFDIRFEEKSYKRTLQVGKDSPAFETPVDLNLFDYISPVFEGENGNGIIDFPNEKKACTLTFGSGKTLELTIGCAKSWSSFALTINIPETGEMVYAYFNIDRSSDLSNADTITLTLDENDLIALRRCGIRVTSYESTYTVSGLT